MSIIFGYIDLNGKPVERGTLENMQHAMDFWHPDGSGLWLEGCCGLGNLLLYNTPEALFEKLPMTDASGNLVMTAGARIDNRDELFRIFNTPLGERLTMPDGKLMLMAYERWGEACADHLVGDWAMAVWDKKTQKLFLARDHHGITAMYYYKGNDFFVFSSSLKGILCLTQVPKKINEYKIAQLLVNWNEGGPQTCYLDIMRLPPAHTLTLTLPSTRTLTLNVNRYWYLEHTPEVRLKSDQEYVDMFLELYTEAVRCRLRSYRPVGATLSSGLDSGSVCILAARELAKEGKRLPAYTAVPLYDITGLVPKNRIGDEGPYAQALADKMGNIDVTFCKAENISPLEGVELKMKVHDQPIFSAQNAYWILDVLINCKNAKKGTLLIAQSGNATVSWPPAGLLEQNRKRIKSFLRSHKNYVKFLLGFWEKNFFVNSNLIKKVRLKKAIKDAKAYPYFMCDLSLKEIRNQIIKPGSSPAGDIWHENGIYFKIDNRDPTIDVRLLKYLWGIPSDCSVSYNRMMFKDNFQDVFLDYIIEGKLRGMQAVDLIKRLNEINIYELINIRENQFCSQKKIKHSLYKLNGTKANKLLKLKAIDCFLSDVLGKAKISII